MVLPTNPMRLFSAMSSPKSRKKAKLLSGFKIYRDQKGRFVSKVVWQSLSKNKRKSGKVAVQRDVKGRFVSEKFLPASARIAKEKVKPKKKRIAKEKVKPKKKRIAKEKVKPKKKRKVIRCNYHGIFETPVSGVTGHYNVHGSRQMGNLIPNLRAECLATLIEDQLKRGAVRFRIWYKVESSPQYPQGIASTEPFWYTKFQGKGGVLGYLNRLKKPVRFYWLRTKDFRIAKVGDINLHGVAGNV